MVGDGWKKKEQSRQRIENINHASWKISHLIFFFFFDLLGDYQAFTQARIVMNHRKYDEEHQTALREREKGTLTMSFGPSSLALSFFCMVRVTAEKRGKRE